VTPMSKDWKIIKLSDIVNHKKGFAFKSKWYRKEGRRIIKVSDFTDRGIDITKSVFIDSNLGDKFNNVTLESGAIIIATVGSWPNNPASIVGKVIKVPKDANNSLLNQNAVKIYPKDEKELNNEFLFHRLKNNDFSQHLIGGAQGSANQASITLIDIYSFELELPPYLEQSSIAKILSDLDTKIELLQNQNNTLEKIGKTIFKQWFVDFEFPNEEGKIYKSSGGDMTESKLGKIPTGWNVNNYGDLLEFERGIEPGSRNYLDKPGEDTVLFYRVGDLLSGESRVYVKKDIIKNKFSKSQNVLVSFDGTVGRVKIGIEGSYSTGIRKVHSKDGSFSNGYIFFLMNSKFIQDKIVEFAKGTTIPHAGEAVKNFLTAIPNEQTRSKFNVLSDKIYLKLLSNLNAIKSLQKTRDLLLPKLMSGQIRVPLDGSK
jgi:type I restriction enzyme, S subunit